MRKIAFALFALFLVAGPALALDMDAKAFYVHGVFSLPTGDFGDFAGNGFGGGVGIKVPHNDQLWFRGEAGYTMFGAKDFEFGFGDDTIEYKWSQIPIVVLAEYQFNYESPFYGLGGAGFHIFKLSVDPDPGLFDDSSTEFGITLGAGYRVNEQIGVEGRYNIISDANQFTINATYRF